LPSTYVYEAVPVYRSASPLPTVHIMR